MHGAARFGVGRAAVPLVIGHDAVAALQASVNQKVLPSPGVLSAPTSPPINCASVAGDGQPEAGAAVLARGRHVGLLEGTWNSRPLLRRNADAGVLTSKRTSKPSPPSFQQLGAQVMLPLR
jgi:hypothetical protein